MNLSKFLSLKSAMLLGLMLTLSVWAFLVSPRLVHAATKPSQFDQFIRSLQHHYDATNSFAANFKQTLTSASGPSRERSGKIYYEKPGKLRWEFAPPQAETIVSDGGTLFDFDPGLNQVVEMPLKDAFKTHTAAAFILGIGNLQHDFIIEPLKSADSDNHVSISLKPKEGGDKVELSIDRPSLNIESVLISDALGSTNLITLSSLQRNIPLNAALFKFTPPPDADIVAAPSHR